MHLPQDPNTQRVLRTTASMRDVYRQAQAVGGSEGEALLKEHGLREVEVCQPFSSLY